MFRPSLTALLFACACFVGSAAPARAIDLAPLRPAESPLFSADVSVSVDTAAHAAVVVTFTVPYSELNWSRRPGGFAAGAGFTVEFDPERGSRLYGDSWQRRVLIEAFDATTNAHHNLIVARSFDLPPGRYRVRLKLQDLNSEMESNAQDRLVVSDLSRVPVGFADLQLGVLDSLAAFTPLPTRRFGFNSGQVAALASLFDRRPGPWPRHYPLHWRLVDETEEVVAQGDTTLDLAQSAEPHLVRPGHPNLFIGSYDFELELVEGKSRWKTSRSFEVEESGPPRGKEFDVLLEALAYVADAAEIDGLRNRTPDEQAVLWERFWRRRDPTPETARNEYQIEFFRRLRYADQHFTGFGHGWRSDMGRIYIRHGAPDQIEQRAASSTTPLVELWFYNQPYRRYVFADREGFGRFTLVTPVAE